MYDRINTLESQQTKHEKKISEMSRAVSKLASFKQSVLESLANDDEMDELKGMVGSHIAQSASSGPPISSNTITKAHTTYINSDNGCMTCL